MTLVREEIDVEGILWTHEYGHNRGLDDVGAADRVMNGVIAPSNRRVTQAECNAYTSSSPTLSARGQVTRPAMPIEEFVRQRFVHGVPYDSARSFGEAAVPRLLQFLNDPGFQSARANVILTLGMIGDNRAAQPLISYLEQGDAALSRLDVVAKRSVPVALGYLYYQTKNEIVLNYLIRGVDAGQWKERIRWRSAVIEAVDPTRQLITASIHGLGLSGSPIAQKVLSDVANRNAPLRDVAQEAMNVNNSVRLRGAVAFIEMSRGGI